VPLFPLALQSTDEVIVLTLPPSEQGPEDLGPVPSQMVGIGNG
jgi:hypothetical protein